MKKIGIIGGAGYTAGELLRLLINHPEVSIAFVHSTSNAGQPVTSVHGGLLGETDLVFSDTHPLEDIDILFLCSAHGHSRKFWEENERPENLMVIDLAQDFRDESEGYVYGLPEVNLNRIEGAKSVANPGCFATALQLSLLPLAAAGLLPKDGDINITALTGSTGAGVKPGATTHFSWRNDNISVYKPFTH
ncbi:MAG: N-acetyl-gamma-glutamyl-phosphate reductase, partial [Muribaculaceae bacterium]|nr:N-acetyl-gamma-glutamyl-phosphate reductase [Muribaculaceae bacterium]